MTSATDIELIKSLFSISDQLNRYFSLIILIFGIVGCILNCHVLYQKSLRSNTCAAYFLLASLVDLISILSGLPTRVLAGWHLDPTTNNDFICKFRAFIVFSTRTISVWLITLATIDRWLLSSMNPNYRRLSTLKNVKKCMIFCCTLSICSFIHMLYCYKANLLDGPLPCYAKNFECRLTTDLMYIFFTITIPLILMITFGLMSVFNVRRAQNRLQQKINLVNEVHLTRRKRLNKKRINLRFLRMLLLQVFILILCCIPQAIEKLYITFNPFNTRSDLRDVLQIFLYNIVVLLAFIQNIVPFYLYTLAGGSIFRKALMKLIQRLNHKMQCFLA